LFVPFNFIHSFFRVRKLSFGRQARGRRRAKKKTQEKNLKKKFRKKKSNPQSNPNWIVSSVFDSFRQQTSIGHNFCIRTPFSMCDHSKCSAQKVLFSHSAVRPSERSEFPEEFRKVEFLPFKVSDPEIPADLHLYLAFELFLSACCAPP
jgi:hypothetical protein